MNVIIAMPKFLPFGTTCGKDSQLLLATKQQNVLSNTKIVVAENH